MWFAACCCDRLRSSTMSIRSEGANDVTRPNDVMQPSLRSAVAAVVLASLFTLVSITLSTPGAAAQSEASAAHELVVGTKDAPPFAIKNDEGEWSGVSIDLWRKIADQLKLKYRFVETSSVTSLLDGVQDGSFDLAVAAITITPPREELVDFTVPYFHTGTGVAVQTDHLANWMPVIRSIASFSFAQAAVALLGLAFLAGFLIWLFERKANEGFGGGVAHGLSSGVLWSTHTMT